MKFNKTNELVSLAFSLLVGCASHSIRFTNSGWIEYHKNGMQVEMIEDRIPIDRTKFYIEGYGSSEGDAKYNARWLLMDLYFYGVNPYLLESVNKNNNSFIEEGERKEYYLKRYLYNTVKQ